MTDRDRFIDILAREIAYNGCTVDAYGRPPSDEWLSEFYGRDWLDYFLPAAIAAVMKAEAAGFTITGPEDGR